MYIYIYVVIYILVVLEITKEMKSILESNSQPCIYSNTIHYREGMNSTQILVNRGMNKVIVVHLHNGILLSHKEK